MIKWAKGNIILLLHTEHFLNSVFHLIHITDCVVKNLCIPDFLNGCLLYTSQSPRD